METIAQITAALFAAFLFYIFYSYSFFRPRTYKLQIVALLFGAPSVGLGLLLQTCYSIINPHPSLFIRSFFIASLLEEFAKMLFIFLLIKLLKEIEINFAEGLFYGIILGMSFGITENIFYGINSTFWPTLLRSITSLPLHLLTSGIAAYFLMLFDFSNHQNDSWEKILKGFFIVILLHGIYDYSIFSGSNLIVIPVLLVLIFIMTEYFIARAKTYLPSSVLALINLSLDDYECIRHHRHHLQWLDKEQNSNVEIHYPLFKKMSPVSFSVFLIFSILGISMAILYFYSPESIGVYFKGIGFGEYIDIFIFYPLFISLNYLLGGLLNPDFISNRIMITPLIIMTEIQCGNYTENSIVFAIEKKMFFATLEKPEMLRGKLNISFWISGQSFDNYPAKVTWINSSDEDIGKTGALIVLDSYHFPLNFFLRRIIFKHIMNNIISSFLMTSTFKL